ncbi:MAG: TIGR02266 family protein, partial [Myxococcota bacterium]
VLANYFRVPYRGGIPVDYPGRDVLLQSRITNISKNGVFVVTGNPLPKGSQFEISFQIPGTKQPVTAECVVRWSNEDEDEKGIRGMGLEFTQISRKDRKAVERMVKEFLTEMRKKGAAARGSAPDAPGPNEVPASPKTEIPPATPSYADTVENAPFAGLEDDTQ